MIAPTDFGEGFRQVFEAAKQGAEVSCMIAFAALMIKVGHAKTWGASMLCAEAMRCAATLTLLAFGLAAWCRLASFKKLASRMF